MEQAAPKTVLKAFRFPVELLSQLEVEVAKTGISTSDFVRGAVEEVLTKRASGGWIPPIHWVSWSQFAEAAGHKSVISWIEELIQKTLTGPAENRPNLDQPLLENLTHQVDHLFRKEEGQVRHFELSATYETFVLLRLWLEKTQPELISKAHTLAEEHYRQARAEDIKTLHHDTPLPSQKQRAHEVALS